MASPAEIEWLKLMAGGDAAARKRSRAQALLGTEAPKAIQAGGWYVAPGASANLGTLLARGVGALKSNQADEMQAQSDQTMQTGLKGIVDAEKKATADKLKREQDQYLDEQNFKQNQQWMQDRQFRAGEADRKARLQLDRERLTQDAWRTETDPVSGGIVMFNTKTAEVKPITDPAQGGKVAPPGKMTDTQSKAFETSSRMADDVKLMREAGDQKGIKGKWDALVTGLRPSLVGKLIPREWATDNGQKYFMAARDLLAAQLRKESGGAITDSEWEEFGPLYIPMPGDTDDVKAAKYARLDKMVSNYQVQSGPQGARYLQAQQAQSPQAAVAAPAQANVREVGGKRYTFENGKWWEEGA